MTRSTELTCPSSRSGAVTCLMDSLRTRFTVTVKLHTNWETHTNAITTALPYSIVKADSGTSSAAKAGANSVAMNRRPDAIRRRSARCLRRLRWRPRSARWRAADGPWAQAIPYSRCGRCRIPARKPRAAGGQSCHVATAEHGRKLAFYKESQRFRATRLAGPKSAHTRQGRIPRTRNAPPSGATLFCWTTPTRKTEFSSIQFCIGDLILFDFICFQLSYLYGLFLLVLSICYQKFVITL